MSFPLLQILTFSNETVSLVFQIHHHNDDNNNTEASVVWYPPNLPENQVTVFLSNHVFPLPYASFSLKRQVG